MVAIVMIVLAWIAEVSGRLTPQLKKFGFYRRISDNLNFL